MMTGLPTPLIRSSPAAAAAAGGLAYGYDNPVRGSPCVPLPQTGGNPLHANRAGGAWSTWREVTAGEASDYILAQAILQNIVIASETWWVELGVGAFELESAIITLAGQTLISGTGAIPLPNEVRRLPPYLLTAGTRLAFRVRASPGTNTNDFRVGLFVHAWASPPTGFITSWAGDDYIKGNTGNLQLITPAIPGSTTVTSSAVANAYGAWVQFIASASQRLRIIGVQRQGLVNARAPHYQVGTGAVASEVAHELTSAPSVGIIGPMGWCPFPRGVDVNSGERVALRVRDQAAAATNYSVALVYEQINV